MARSFHLILLVMPMDMSVDTRRVSGRQPLAQWDFFLPIGSRLGQLLFSLMVLLYLSERPRHLYSIDSIVTEGEPISSIESHHMFWDTPFHIQAADALYMTTSRRNEYKRWHNKRLTHALEGLRNEGMRRYTGLSLSDAYRKD